MNSQRNEEFPTGKRRCATISTIIATIITVINTVGIATEICFNIFGTIGMGFLASKHSKKILLSILYFCCLLKMVLYMEKYTN